MSPIDNPHPWLSQSPPQPWQPPAEWVDTPFAKRRLFFASHPTHCNGWCVCPCCGYPTLEDKGQNSYCVFCFWEDDYQDDPWADYDNGGPNVGTLNQARHNVIAYGSSISWFDPDIPERTRQLIQSVSWQRRQTELKTAFSRLMELEGDDAIAEQWVAIDVIWMSDTGREG